MRILGSLVMKNEADRYLESVLEYMTPLFDGVFAWDDQSDDSSVDIADEYAEVRVRPDSCPSFLEHEGRFRAAAWQSFESAMHPVDGDWVLAFDADEFLVTKKAVNVGNSLRIAIQIAEKTNCIGIVLPFPEIFDIINGTPHYRTDGLWGTIAGPRLFRYSTGGTFSDKPMGCGAEPTYVGKGKLSRDNNDLHMLHYGYAEKEDHARKHKIYTELTDHGHNNKHVQSIIESPTLEPWTGQVPYP